MLVGSATRLISGRNAVQTVYWRVKKDGATTRLVKSNKTCTFNKNTKYPRSMFRPIEMKFNIAQ
ncbi:uncharacterized protein LOC119650110 [Hermetia illucens]|uniref:uncharacterized protein LOC119650110 n=1 Tax=Hermetia illucens TaxID=343691 RepID=UPI0018CC4600|nr:uncharacterized protein LOC119650110 [Hermetia illucens]